MILDEPPASQEIYSLVFREGKQS